MFCKSTIINSFTKFFLCNGALDVCIMPLPEDSKTTSTVSSQFTKAAALLPKLMTRGEDRGCMAWSSDPDWAKILPWPLTMRCKVEELVHPSTSWPESGLFLLNPRLYNQMESPLQNASILFLGGWGVQLPYNWNPPSGTTYPVCQSRGTDLQATLKRHVNHATPSLSSGFNISG